MAENIKIGTRGSLLALAQAHETKNRLIEAGVAEESAVEIIVIKTTGDRITDRALSEAGGKGLFTKELEEALYDKTIDLAVHSAKDMPTVLPDGLVISTFLPREDIRDAFISRTYGSLAEMPEGALVGSASLRRQAQLRRLRPDLRVDILRGNVQTRLAKLDAGVCDATLLAMAGLNRLGAQKEVREILPLDDFLPAAGQGAVCIEIREDDLAIREKLSAIHDPATETALLCERAYLRVMDGSCRTPIAGHAHLEGDQIHFRGEVLSPDGTQDFSVEMSGPASNAAALGEAAGQKIIAEAGAELLASLRI